MVYEVCDHHIDVADMQLLTQHIFDIKQSYIVHYERSYMGTAIHTIREGNRSPMLPRTSEPMVLRPVKGAYQVPGPAFNTGIAAKDYSQEDGVESMTQLTLVYPRRPVTCILM